MGSVGTEAADAVMGKENADNIRQRKKINICFALRRDIKCSEVTLYIKFYVLDRFIEIIKIVLYFAYMTTLTKMWAQVSDLP